MGRSQRHMILEQGAPANGEAITEGQPAPAFISQATEVQARGGPLSGSTTVDLENLEVVVGPPGGPLQGSTVSSAVPSDLDNTTPPEEEEFHIVGFNPNDIPAGYPDLSVEVLGQGFTDSAVVNFDGTDMATEFLSEQRLRFLCPSSTAVVGPVPVTVSQGGYVTAVVEFNFIEEPAKAAPSKRRKKAD